MKAHRILRQKSQSAWRLVRALAADGRQNGVRHAASLASRSLRGLELRSRPQALIASEFDRRHGVDTSGFVRIASMDIDSPNYVHAVYYKASEPDQFNAALCKLPIRYEDYTFVDYGSGKGLTLLLASEFPFRRIVGVEFAKDLHAIALENIGRYRSDTQRCHQVEPLCLDATALEPPAGPLVCYFYDPFETCILEKVLERIERSYAATPRDIIVIYHGAPQNSAMHYEDRLRSRLFAAKPFLAKWGEAWEAQYLFFRSCQPHPVATRLPAG
jgi:hypothetical protein